MDDVDQRPVIGLSAYATRAAWGVWDQDATLLPQTYVAAVAGAGGLPVLLPALPGIIGGVLDRLDGVLIAGGPDVDPARYGAEPGPDTQPPSRARDAAETELIDGAVARGLPVLAICRGLQLLNVTRGGTLIQHLPDVARSTRHCPTPGRHGTHEVRFAEGSRLAAVLGGPDGGWATVPSYHHQAIDTLGSGLVATAWAEDGVIEAVEDPRLPFCIGVQWHPETGDDPALFAGLVAAARSGAVTAAGHAEMTPGEAAELDREANRVASRLRVLGPRWAARRHEPDAAALDAVRTTLQSLADLAADADGVTRRPVPELALHALADQVLVLAHDAALAGVDATARELLVALRRAL